jgi:hypothetical protein
MEYEFLLTAYQGLVGPVKGADIGRSLELMGKGMAGIFLVMLLIFLVIVILNRITKNKD